MTAKCVGVTPTAVLRASCSSFQTMLQKPEHRADRQPVGFAVERWQRMIGAKNVAGAVDEEEMIAFFHGKNA